MKSLVNLCMALLTDVGRICSVDTTRDLETIRKRAKHEGVSFLTITLPKFAEDFETSLERGSVDPTCFAGWRKRGCLPAFMQGFTGLVFDNMGGLRDETVCDAVFCIRQVCRAFKKIRLDCSIERTRQTFEKYKLTEAALAKWERPENTVLEHFARTCDFIWSDVFCSRGEFNPFDLVPRHGPGATAERISGNAKFNQRRWYARLEREFPVTEFVFTSVNHLLSDDHGLQHVVMVQEPDEMPVRVISVPKTLKAPRIIAIEPVCMQYTQQAVGRYITKMIKASVLTRQSIRFDDQVPNQQMAMRGSSDGSLATIDLSDASDRVPLSMVATMLRSQPDLSRAVFACRSRRAELPDHSIIELEKFASMGSALCFPIESMYFFSIIVHAILESAGSTLSRRNVLDVVRRVHVFGDDIIVPADQTDIVMRALAQFNCKVNTTKTFWKGKFRESCGLDAYQGQEVTPIYVREPCPLTKRDASGLVSWIATSNLFHQNGMWAAADFMKSEVERCLGSLPVVAETSPGLGWVSFQGPGHSPRMCKFLHVPLVRTYTVRPKEVPDPLDGYPALLKYFLRAYSAETEFALPRSASIDKRHLTCSARFGTVSRKRRWVPAF